MSLKLSPGCNCCVGVCEACSNTTFKNEYDVTLSGLSNGTLCDECEVLNGTFSLLTQAQPARVFGTMLAAHIIQGANILITQ